VTNNFDESNGKEYSINLSDYKDYNTLATIAIFGQLEAAMPGIKNKLLPMF
jgi:hypothetical protein